MNHTPVTDTMELGVPGVLLEPGDHICALYVSQTERDQIMLPFLRAGLQAGHKCFCVVDSSPTSQALEDLGDDDATLASLSEHQLELFTAGETHLRTRPFSRITGEMAWALHDLPVEREESFRYEAELNPYYLSPDQYLSSRS
jgi:hypothetical protein